MFRRHLLSLHSTILGLGLVFGQQTTAFATQPLAEFVEASKTHSFDAKEQSALVKQRESEADVALGRLLPSLTARGVYTHNQYNTEVTFPIPGQPETATTPEVPPSSRKVEITPYNQWDAAIQLDVPLVDLSNFARRDQALALTKVANVQGEVTRVDTARSVTRAYYSFIGASAQMAAAERSIQVATDNLNFVSTRRELGTANELDLERAKANLESARTSLSDAELSRTLAARTLETQSGISPSPATDYAADDLRPEAALDEWLNVHDTPSQRLQSELLAVSRLSSKVADRALMPTLNAAAVQRFSNAAGFSGHGASYQITATLAWKLDYGAYANTQAQTAAETVQQVREQKLQRTEQDVIFEAYHRVRSGIAKSTSLRAQARAAEKAADIAKERYAVGAATQLDVTQAQRDAFQAEAGRLQADAELAYARASLWIAAGKPVAEHERRFPHAPIAQASQSTIPGAQEASPAVAPASAAPAAVPSTAVAEKPAAAEPEKPPAATPAPSPAVKPAVAPTTAAPSPAPAPEPQKAGPAPATPAKPATP